MTPLSSESTVDNLISDAAKLFRELEKILDAERSAIREANVPQLDQCNLQKEFLLQKLAPVDKSLRKKNWSELRRDLPELEPLIYEIETLAGTVREKNRYNSELLAAGLKHIEQMKSAILGDTEPKANVYSPSGAYKSPTSGEARFVSKQV